MLGGSFQLMSHRGRCARRSAPGCREDAPKVGLAPGGAESP